MFIYAFTEGVDTVDKMLSCYSSKRKTNNWPTAVFGNMIDISALNAYIIFKKINPNWHSNQKTMRRIFLRELALSLATPYMNIRKGIPRTEPSASVLSAFSSSSLERSTSTLCESVQKRSKSESPKARCHICFSKKTETKNNLYQTMCCFCKKGVYKDTHNRNVCINCIADKLI